MARRRERWRLVEGTEVSPRRAFEAFCRCEQTCARLTRDMVRCVEESPRGQWSVDQLWLEEPGVFEAEDPMQKGRCAFGTNPLNLQ